MPVRWEQDDERRLLTVRVTDPYSVNDILAILDRLAAEDAWDYSILFDVRDVKDASGSIRRW